MENVFETSSLSRAAAAPKKAAKALSNYNVPTTIKLKGSAVVGATSRKGACARLKAAIKAGTAVQFTLVDGRTITISKATATVTPSVKKTRAL